jgi:hypothetical protein
MTTIAERANELEQKARIDAEAKLRRFHENVGEMWSHANSIPSGCGGTPFRADARDAESKLRIRIVEFRRRFGDEALDKLKLFYGRSL